MFPHVCQSRVYDLGSGCSVTTRIINSKSNFVELSITISPGYPLNLQIKSKYQIENENKINLEDQD